MRILKNILAVILGWLGGSFVNIGLVQLGYAIFPLEGVDVDDMEALAEVMPSLGSEHFVFPFLAHALGTLAGAFFAGSIAATHKMTFSYVIGGLFLIGGITINYILPGPSWFLVLDIVVAYIPMAWIGGNLAKKLSKSN